eukprot:snap_masked-scaffold_6-processed-gene-4.30-mRNA-1 protein AED:1.00 eAED:1.00 QI:0/0/0/0/1/1/2/0/633
MNASVEGKKLFQFTRTCCANQSYLRKLVLRFSSVTLEEFETNEIQDIINSHHFLILFEIPVRRKIDTKKLYNRLKEYVQSELRVKYNKKTVLNEAQVLFMGDGRVGKTSSIRTMFERKFQIENDSTIVLNDVDVFGISPNNYQWKSISRYQLSLQRVKNSLPVTISNPLSEMSKSKGEYQFSFEEEIFSRTVADEDFVETMKTNTFTFASSEIYFRVYDFGGQEIFSSVHNIFMNPNALYFVVFNMSKLKGKDIQRFIYWCESILRNAPEAPILLLGTYLNKYLKKNENDVDLKNINEKMEYILSSLSHKMCIIQNNKNSFFPIENSKGKGSKEINKIKSSISSIVSGASGLNKQGLLNFQVTTAQVLFLDNCREESSFLTLKQFKEKATCAGFNEVSVIEMLESYSKAGIICYFPELDLEDYQNFIYFAPSYLAQALGKFIRDPSVHQLAFRVPTKDFHSYRYYVDTGKISKNLFHIFLREYKEYEIKFILELAINALILLTVEKERDIFILPGLLPEVSNSKIQPIFRGDMDVVFTEYLTLTDFTRIAGIFQVQQGVTQFFLFKGFARIIIGIQCVIDIFRNGNKIMSIDSIQGSKSFFTSFIEAPLHIVRDKLRNRFDVFDRKQVEGHRY